MHFDFYLKMAKKCCTHGNRRLFMNTLCKRGDLPNLNLGGQKPEKKGACYKNSAIQIERHWRHGNDETHRVGGARRFHVRIVGIILNSILQTQSDHVRRSAIPASILVPLRDLSMFYYDHQDDDI